MSRLERMYGFGHMYQKPDIYRFIRSNFDRLGFYAEIQINFRTAIRYGFGYSMNLKRKTYLITKTKLIILYISF